MLKVRNMTSPRTGREVANQFIIEDYKAGTEVFQSYDSTIVEINWRKKVITIHSAWNYSTTTGKYRNAFMEENGFYDMSNKKGFEYYMNLGAIGDYEIVKAF